MININSVSNSRLNVSIHFNYYIHNIICMRVCVCVCVVRVCVYVCVCCVCACMRVDVRMYVCYI